MLLQNATGMVSSDVDNPYGAVQDLALTRTLASSRVECDLCGGTLSQWGCREGCCWITASCTWGKGGQEKKRMEE